MTLPYLNAFPNTGDLQLIEDLGFKGVRFDVKNLDQVPAIANLRKHPGLTPVAIIDHYDVCIPVAEEIAKLGRGAIELVNEPDLNGWNPRDWAAFTKACLPAIRVEELHGVPIPVVSGGISNLNHRQLDFLEDGLAAGLACDVVGWHRYRTESPPATALKDYGTRAQEFQALRRLTRGKPDWCTETGWNTAGRFTDADVAQFAREEYAIQKAADVTVMVWYQITDGPTAHYEDHFGIRRIDGSLKPVAHVWGGLS